MRNDQRILEGATRELGRHPAAGMDEIARACGVSRASLFRRHPSRDGLISALREHAHEDLSAAVERAELDHGTPPEALERLVDELLAVATPYAFLLQNPTEPGHEEGTRHIAKDIEALIRRGQAAGDFDPSAPPQWWVEVIVAVLTVAARAEREDSGGRNAAELMRRTLASGLMA